MTAPVEYRTVSEEKNKPVADEQTLAKLLEAAYVLQEHNREMQDLHSRPGFKRDQDDTETLAAPPQHPSPATKSPAPATGDNTFRLARIVETQQQIQVRRLEFANALKLIAERVLELTNAVGVAIGIIEGKNIRYRAVSGRGIPERDTVVALHKSILAPCLKTGLPFCCADTSTEVLLDPDEWERRGIHSLIAVPVYHDGGVVGGLELYFASTNSFPEQEVNTSQLMAGLVAEALVREEEATWKRSLASERAAMLEALEKLQPNLAALVEKSPEKNATSAKPVKAAPPYTCRKCGHRLMAGEQFCGQCGSPRAGDYEPPNTQSKVASLWQMQKSQMKRVGPELPANGEAKPTDVPESWGKTEAVRPEASLARSLEQQIPDLFMSEDQELSSSNEAAAAIPPEVQEIAAIEGEQLAPQEDSVSGGTPESSQALVKTEAKNPAVWTSAASARAFLDQLASSQGAGKVVAFWNRHRGDFYLGVAIILVLCVMRWGILSDHSVKATANPAKSSATQRKPAPDAGLSLVDRMLVQLGLADAPEPSPDKGNPAVQVWVDLHTALYYCPGADLYGKTVKGKVTSQRAAQLDQFEPAYRKPCK